LPAERHTARVTAIDVVVAGFRIRIESTVPGLAARQLARSFAGHATRPRSRPDARLRVEAAPTPRAWRVPARLSPRAAAALRPIPARLRGRRAQRRELEDGLAALLGAAPVAARADVGLAHAAAPVAFPWGNGAFVGDLARPSGTLFLSRWRSRRDVEPPLLNAHGVLLAVLAIERGGLLIHSGAVVAGGKAYLLVGRSGAGKSTLSRRARGAALSDDGVLIVPHREQLRVAATPLRQRAGCRTPRGPGPAAESPLGGVLLLRQARRTALRPMSPAVALAEIVSRHLHFFALLPPRLATRALRNAAAILAATPAYRLRFTREADVRVVLAAAGPAHTAACGPCGAGRY
jgi:hypothetical protein